MIHIYSIKKGDELAEAISGVFENFGLEENASCYIEAFSDTDVVSATGTIQAVLEQIYLIRKVCLYKS